MAAPAGKTKKLKFTYDLLKRDALFQYDFKDESRKIVEGNKEISKFFKPLQIEVEVPEEDAEDEGAARKKAYSNFNGGVKLLDERVKQYRSDPKKIEAAYKEFTRNSQKNAAKAFEKKPETSKSAAAGKQAMEELKKLDLKTAFDKPLRTAQETVKALRKGKPDARALQKANKDLSTAHSEFRNAAETALDVIEEFFEAADRMGKDKSKSVQDTGKQIMKFEKTFDKFIEGAGDAVDALERAVEATKGDEVDAEALETIERDFEALAAFDKTAQGAVAVLKKLEPLFRKAGA